MVNKPPSQEAERPERGSTHRLSLGIRTDAPPLKYTECPRSHRMGNRGRLARMEKSGHAPK